MHGVIPVKMVLSSTLIGRLRDRKKEYNEALEEAKYAWRDTCEDGSEFGLDPEDYETRK